MSESSSTLFHNGNILTVGRTHPGTDAVLVERERIVAVGTTRELERLAPARTRRYDLGGRTLMPGFIDTHGHVGLFGLDELKVRLAGATSKDDILARLGDAVRRAAAGEWVVAMPIGDPPYYLNADRLRAEGAVPTLADLDQLAPDNPVYIQAPTNRVPNFAVINSAAMRAAGIDETTRVSEHSNVQCDPNGRPTGILTGALQPIYNADPLYQMIEQVAPRPDYGDIRNGIAALAPQFARHGTTTLLEAHLTDPEELRAYAELAERDALPLRIFYTFEIDFTRSLDDIADYLRTVRFAANGGFGSAQVRVCGVSIGLDGPYWHGAACHDRAYIGPFGESVNPGPLMEAQHYRAILDLAASMNFRIHAEAAGRGSIELALDAFDKIDQRTPIAGKRYVLEHCEFPTLEQIATCARLGIAPTTSTNFIWGKGAEVYRARLGDETAARAIPLRDWLDAGVPVSQSTDWGPHEAFFTVWQSLARHAGMTGEVIGPAQVITREEALRIFTLNGAWALKMERELGSIEVGKRADLIIVNGDPLSCDLDDLPDLNVDLTVIDGRTVYEQ